MKSYDNVGVTFVNTVLGSGFLNGIINIQLATALFDLNAEGKIDQDVVPSCRLRMDIPCAMRLREALDDAIKAVITPTTSEPQTPSSTEDTPTVDAARLN